MKYIAIKIISMILIAMMATSCSCSGPTEPDTDTFIGTWGTISSDYETGIIVYERMNELDGQRNGYKFSQDGLLQVRSGGWCGSGSITYSNHEGSWVAESDSVLILSYHSLQVMRDFRLEIVSVDNDEMVCQLTEVR